MLQFKRGKNEKNHEIILISSSLRNNIFHEFNFTEKTNFSNFTSHISNFFNQHKCHYPHIQGVTILQYVNGGSLDQIIISGSRPSEEFPWSDRVSMANDINEGLTYLHSRGIFHRDLTSKVIIQNNPKCYIEYMHSTYLGT